MVSHKTEVTVGKTHITFETGELARLANGAVLLRTGDTAILATACMAPNANPEADFFPLRVDYTERFSSVGKTLQGYIKREGRPTSTETIISRLIDRPLRPMFPEGFMNEVQLIAQVLSFDAENQLEPHAINAVSAALQISDVPSGKTVAAVRIGYLNDQFIINPTIQNQEKSKLNLVLAGTHEAILMIEGGCNFLSEEQILEAISLGHHEIKKITHAIDQLVQKCGKKKADFVNMAPPHALIQEIESRFGSELKEALFQLKKADRSDAVSAVQVQITDEFTPKIEKMGLPANRLQAAIKIAKSNILRKEALTHNKRIDGRSLDQVRPISVKLGLFSRTHGSALFTRGETQALCIATLGSTTSMQKTESLYGDVVERCYLQYSFPPFSVGEVGRLGTPGRREVGHGKLAERAILEIIPTQENFPYSMRIESNILESNGSSSQASVCGGALALLDAGVPIKELVSGVAMGLILEKNRYVVLTDILGTEDDLGDMDFKVAGGASGITSFQMDIKVEGITIEIMKEALSRAKEGRMHILEEMKKAVPSKQKGLSKFAPRLVNIKIHPNKIGTLIGPGGKQIRLIQALGVTVDVTDEGMVTISGNDAEAVEKAHKMVSDIVAEVEVGKTYTGEVVSIVPFGAFIALPGQKEGLLHVSEIAHERVNNVEDYLKEKQQVEVKVLEINDRGQIRLSRKVLLPKEKKETVQST
ncbi:MAG: polyribonucleotide nucleotidyltransferase [Chlamydiae bacterium]|nr:polyribonucleotide nucleotidyltransferase [Chlamydiota bacterium]